MKWFELMNEVMDGREEGKRKKYNNEPMKKCIVIKITICTSCVISD